MLYEKIKQHSKAMEDKMKQIKKSEKEENHGLSTLFWTIQYLHKIEKESHLILNR